MTWAPAPMRMIASIGEAFGSERHRGSGSAREGLDPNGLIWEELVRTRCWNSLGGEVGRRTWTACSQQEELRREEGVAHGDTECWACGERRPGAEGAADSPGL